jgi:hypothetical protein
VDAGASMPITEVMIAAAGLAAAVAAAFRYPHPWRYLAVRQAHKTARALIAQDQHEKAVAMIRLAGRWPPFDEAPSHIRPESRVGQRSPYKPVAITSHHKTSGESIRAKIRPQTGLTGATTTETGCTSTPNSTRGDYPTKVKLSNQQMAQNQASEPVLSAGEHQLGMSAKDR